MKSLLQKRELLVVYVNITLYAVCYMAQVPVLPYLTKKLGADSATYGMLQTFFSTMQFVGGLLAGPLVDRYGGKTLLQISFLASALCYALTAVSNNMLILYVSRIPTLLQHAVLAARTIVTLLTDDSERATQIGYVGMAYGVGFAVGPALGGAVSQISLDLAAWLAAAGSVLSLLLVTFLLPGTDQQQHSKKNDDSGPATDLQQKSLTERLGELWEVCRVEGVPHLLVAKFVAGMALALFQSMFSPMLQHQFGLNSKQNGLVLSYLGVITIAVQVGLVSWATRTFSDVAITELCTMGLVLGYVGQAMAGRVELVLLAMLPLVAAGVLFSTVNTAQLTKAVPSSQSGSIIAVDMAVGSGVRMLSPAVGGFLAASPVGYPAVSWAAAALTAVLLVLLKSQVLDVMKAERMRKSKAE